MVTSLAFGACIVRQYDVEEDDDDDSGEVTRKLSLISDGGSVNSSFDVTKKLVNEDGESLLDGLLSGSNSVVSRKEMQQKTKTKKKKEKKKANLKILLTSSFLSLLFMHTVWRGVDKTYGKKKKQITPLSLSLSLSLDLW